MQRREALDGDVCADLATPCFKLAIFTRGGADGKMNPHSQTVRAPRALVPFSTGLSRWSTRSCIELPCRKRGKGWFFLFLQGANEFLSSEHSLALFPRLSIAPCQPQDDKHQPKGRSASRTHIERPSTADKSRVLVVSGWGDRDGRPLFDRRVPRWDVAVVDQKSKDPVTIG
jgi:hypothetical protein